MVNPPHVRRAGAVGRYVRLGVLSTLLPSCVLGVGGTHDSDIEPEPELTTAALASRALHHTRPLSARLRSLSLSWSARTAAHDARHEQELRLLHKLSVEVLEHLDLFVQFGAFEVPLVRHHTGALRGGSRVKAALALVKRVPSAIVILGRSERQGDRFGLDLVSDVLHRAGEPRELTVDDRVALMRRWLGGVHSVWLVEPAAGRPLSPQTRRAARETRAWHKRLLQFRDRVDPSFAEIVGPLTPGTVHVQAGDTSARLAMVRALLEEAQDVADLERDFVRAEDLLADAEGVCELAVNGTDDPKVLVGRQLVLSEIHRAQEQVIARVEHRQHGVPAPAAAGAQLLRQVIGDSIQFDVPGRDVEATSHDSGTEVQVRLVAPGSGDRTTAPWLYGIEVSAWTLGRDGELNAAVSAANVPLALTHVASGAARFRRLWFHATSRDSAVEASFRDLEPGMYRLSIMSADRHDVGRSGNRPLNGAGRQTYYDSARSWLESFRPRWRGPARSQLRQQFASAA
jgi:hypothetical protein